MWPHLLPLGRRVCWHQGLSTWAQSLQVRFNSRPSCLPIGHLRGTTGLVLSFGADITEPRDSPVKPKLEMQRLISSLHSVAAFHVPPLRLLSRSSSEVSRCYPQAQGSPRLWRTCRVWERTRNLAGSSFDLAVGFLFLCKCSGYP